MGRTIQVSGTACGGCDETVEEAPKDLTGGSGARADREAGAATVEEEKPAEQLLRAVEDAGYEAPA